MIQSQGQSLSRLFERAPERVFTLMLEGELNARELATLDSDLADLARRGQRNIVLELSDVTHLDYRGIPRLKARAEELREAGGDLKLCAVSPYLQAIFRVAGAHSTFEFLPQLEDAFAAFDPRAALN